MVMVLHIEFSSCKNTIERRNACETTTRVLECRRMMYEVCLHMCCLYELLAMVAVDREKLFALLFLLLILLERNYINKKITLLYINF